MSAIISKNCIILGDLGSHCLVCSIHLPGTDDVLAHIQESKHKASLQSIAYLEKYKDDSIRKVKDIYFCEMCNMTVPNPAKLRMHVTQESHLERKRRQIKRVGSSIVFQNKVLISESAWNGFAEDTCIVCDAEYEDYLTHQFEATHLFNLVESKVTVDGKNIYRKIDGGYQCLTCNDVLSDNIISEHLNSELHNSSFVIYEPTQDVKVDIEDTKPIEKKVKEQYEEGDVASGGVVDVTSRYVSGVICKRDPERKIIINIPTITYAEKNILYKMLTQGFKKPFPGSWQIDTRQTQDKEKSSTSASKYILSKEQTQDKEKPSASTSKSISKEQTQDKVKPSASTSKIVTKEQTQGNEKPSTSASKIISKEQTPEKEKASISTPKAISKEQTQDKEKPSTSTSKTISKEQTLDKEKPSTSTSKTISKEQTQGKEKPSTSSSKIVTKEHTPDKEKASTSKETPKTISKEVESFAKQNGLYLNRSNYAVYCNACSYQIHASIHCVKEHIAGKKHKDNMNAPKLTVAPPPEVKKKTKKRIERIRLETYVKSLSHLVSKEGADYVIVNDEFCLSSEDFMGYLKLGHRLICQFCSIDLITSNESYHLDLHRQMMNNMLLIASLEKEFVRQVKSDMYHCGFCAQIEGELEEMLDHLTSPEHKYHKAEYEKLLKKFSKEDALACKRVETDLLKLMKLLGTGKGSETAE